jgi:hypothetical protein
VNGRGIVWLELTGTSCPEGVFTYDVRRRGQGRPPDEAGRALPPPFQRLEKLGPIASLLYEPGKVGYTKVAKSLLPDDYARDPEAAKKRIKQALALFRKHVAAASDPEKLAYRMLGLPEDGSLPEEEMPDEVRAALEEADTDA